MFLYQKLIDRSTLRQGFQIPVEYHYLLKGMPGGIPQYGETRNVKVVIDGVGYDAQLKNQGFDRNKYDGHADVIQIRYSEGSELVKRLREVFSSTWNYVESIKNLPENIHRKFTIRVPEEYQELIDNFEVNPTVPLYGTKVPFAGGEVGEMEKSVLKSYGLEKSDFEVPKMPRLGSHGLRRAMRFQVWDASAVATEDGVMCEFSIDKGSYATAVLREVMKKDVY